MIRHYCPKPRIFSVLGIILLIVLVCGPTFSASNFGKEDGVAFVTLKNDKPCFYLSNDKLYIKIISIKGFDTSEKRSIWYKNVLNYHSGNSPDACIAYSGVEEIKLNTAYAVYLEDQSGDGYIDYHNTEFCMVEKENKLRLVKTKRNTNKKSKIIKICSDEDWKPSMVL